MAEHAMAQAPETERAGASNGDDALMARIAGDRDREAFAELFARHERAAFNLALHLTGRHALAEEAVQDAFLRVWTSASAFQPGNARAWLLRIVANQSLKKVRSKGRRVAVITAQSEAALERAGARDPAPDENLERVETLAALRESLSALPERSRQLVALYYVAGYTQNEIAEALAMPARTVSFKLDEARKRLRASLAQAGVAAAMPVLAAERLGEALGALNPPPAGLFEQFSARLADPAHLAAAQTTEAASRATRRGAAATAGHTSLVAALLAAAATLGAGLWYVNASHSADAPPPASQAKTPEAPAAPVVKAESLPNVNKTWDFAQGPAEDIQVVHRAWEWKRYTPQIAGMTAPLDAPVGILLPLRFPKRPLRVDIEGRFRDVKRHSNLGVHWATETDIPNSHSWYRNVQSTKLPVTVVYLYDRYLIKVFAGQVMSMRRYENPYPAGRILLSFTNYIIERIAVKNVTIDEIPKALRDPMALIEQHGFAQYEGAFPEPQKVPQPAPGPDAASEGNSEDIP
ncbi:MAG: RNA polymerase sigma factor [Planctomycetes bacterium]|nr:RNA polymerase sigma factor [Planctomycetota bacterium]